MTGLSAVNAPTTNTISSCSSSSSTSSLQQQCIVNQAFPTAGTSPAAGSNLVMTHYSSSGCTGTINSITAQPMMWSVCLSTGDTTSASYSCTNGAPSFTTYTDTKCSAGAVRTTPTACQADDYYPGGSYGTGSTSMSCTGTKTPLTTTSTSGAASIVAGAVAAVAAAAAVVALA